jgi:hypothetical protein
MNSLYNFNFKETENFAFRLTNPQLDELLKKEDGCSQFRLGIYFAYVKRDYKQAYEWFLKSAYQNNDDAQLQLWSCLDDEHKIFGLRRDPITAWKWLKKAGGPTLQIAYSTVNSLKMRQNASDAVICFLCIRKYRNSLLSLLNTYIVNLIAWDVLQTRETEPHVWNFLYTHILE